jgi:hypothetical protein
VNDNHGSDAQQMIALRAAFKDRKLTFRHFPDSKVACTRWQALRPVIEPITFSDGSVHLLERHELVGWASTRDELISQLA